MGSQDASFRVALRSRRLAAGWLRHPFKRNLSAKLPSTPSPIGTALTRFVDMRARGDPPTGLQGLPRLFAKSPDGRDKDKRDKMHECTRKSETATS